MSSPAPVIDSVSPSSGPVACGTQVTIFGQNFVNGCRVRFGGVDSPQVTFLSSSRITAVTPPAGSAGPVNVRVVNATQVAGVAPNAFQYIDAPPPPPPPVPVVTSVSPASGPVSGGTQVIITGQNFVPGCVAKFGGVEAQTTFVSCTQLSAVTPASQAEGSVTVRVLNPNQPQAGILQGAFQYVSAPPPPTPALVPFITSVTPSSGPVSGGTQVVITGGNFSPDCRAKFGGVDAQTTFNSSTQLTAVTPQAQTAGPVNVRVVNASQQAGVAQGAFTYVPAPPPPPAPLPVITSVSPSSGPLSGGTQVTIAGQNFAPNCEVRFGGNPAQVLSNSPSLLNVVTPAGAGPGAVNVRVVNSPQQAAVAQNAYIYVQAPPPPPPPIITSVTPSSGPAAGGTPVTIMGQNFAAACQVKFGGAAAQVLSSTPTALQVLTPPTSGPGPVTVRVVNPGQDPAVAQDAFTYTPPPPPPPFLCPSSPSSALSAGRRLAARR